MSDDDREHFRSNTEALEKLAEDIEALRKSEDLNARFAQSTTEPHKPGVEDKDPPAGAEGRTGLPPGKDKLTRAKSFGEFLQAVKRGQDGMLTPEQRAITGMGEASPSDGGFLVDSQQIGKILEIAEETSVLPKYCDKQPIGAGFTGAKFPVVDGSSRADGSRPVRGYWTGEADQMTSSKPKMEMMEVNLDQAVTVFVYVTDWLLEDSTALGSWVGRKAGEEVGFKLDDAIINGSGAGMPLGILNSACCVSQTAEGGQAAATIEANNLIKMHARLKGTLRDKAIVIYNQECEPELMTAAVAVGTGGQLVWMPAGGISGKKYNTLFGLPAFPVEQCAALGTAGDIIFGAFSQYMLADKGGISSASSIHVRFDYNETCFRFVYRCDGGPTWSKKQTQYKGSNTLAPFVKLATRA